MTKTETLGVRYHSTPTILCGCMPGVASLGFKIALHSHKAGFWAKIQKIGNVHSLLLILTICCSPILAVNTQEIDAHRSLEKIRKAEDHLKKMYWLETQENFRPAGTLDIQQKWLQSGTS